MSWSDKVKTFGEPQVGSVYTCILKAYYSGKTVTAELKYVAKDDCDWRTADDNSEIDEVNWDVIKWELLK